MDKIIILFLISISGYAQIGLGTNSPHASATLELNSTSRGFLPPRMIEFQRDAITSPEAGLIIYCTDCGANGQMQVYNGTTWTNTAGGPVDIALTSVASLDCANVVNNGDLRPNVAASGVSSTINYTGGNGKAYQSQTILSSGVTGLTATLTAGSLVVGNGSITYAITGTPSGWGRATFTINLGGQSCLFNIDVGVLDRAFGQTINGANNHNFVYLPVVAADGTIWLNNNLGADYANLDHPSFNPYQQATSFTDHLAYGSLFQFGRPADGHELINWTNSTTGTAVYGTTTAVSTTNVPENSLFIIWNGILDVYGNRPTKWTTTDSHILWSKSYSYCMSEDLSLYSSSGMNNPCPVGYKVPLNTTQLNSGIQINNDNLSNFTVPGYRSDLGTFSEVGSIGYYWTYQCMGGYRSKHYVGRLNSSTGFAGSSQKTHLNGLSVRCMKE